MAGGDDGEILPGTWCKVEKEAPHQRPGWHLCWSCIALHLSFEHGRVLCCSMIGPVSWVAPGPDSFFFFIPFQRLEIVVHAITFAFCFHQIYLTFHVFRNYNIKTLSHNQRLDQVSLDQIKSHFQGSCSCSWWDFNNMITYHQAQFILQQVYSSRVAPLIWLSWLSFWSEHCLAHISKFQWLILEATSLLNPLI